MYKPETIYHISVEFASIDLQLISNDLFLINMHVHWRYSSEMFHLLWGFILLSRSNDLIYRIASYSSSLLHSLELLLLGLLLELAVVLVYWIILHLLSHLFCCQQRLYSLGLLPNFKNWVFYDSCCCFLEQVELFLQKE